MKLAAERKVKNTAFVSMTLDDLERMKQTGLIDEKELKKVKRSVSEQIVDSTLPTTSQPADLALQEALHDFEQEQKNAPVSPGIQPTPGQSQLEPEIPSETVEEAKPSLDDILGNGDAAPPPGPGPKAPPSPSPVAPTAPLPDPPKREADPSMPLDIDKLRATGAIDEEEYQRLRAYFKRRSEA